MNSSKLKENLCRICLQQKVNLNWNTEITEFCGVTYKDCYYKYTKLEENDPDLYPTNLCEKCCEELKNAHMLFEKALESFSILQNTNYLDMKIFNNSAPAIKSENQAADDKIDDENPCLLPLFSNNTCLKSEANEVETNVIPHVYPTHFIDINNLERPVEMPFEESEVPTSFVIRGIRKKKSPSDKILASAMEKQNENSDTSTSSVKRTRKRKIYEVLPKEKLCEQAAEDTKTNDNKIKAVESKDNAALVNTKNPARRLKEKYLLMCSYCSLKVQGAKKLAMHETTHNEKRERNETCTECGLKFYTGPALNLHMKTHDANRQKNHKCEFCEKAFFNKGALNVHRRIHLGLMIKCQICEKDFYRQVDLDKHLLKHSASPLEKNIGKNIYVAQCQYCNQSILTNKLKEHIAAHMNQPQVKCKICDKNFYSRTKCTKHLRRFHLKKLGEYEDFIHYYVDRNRRMSNLIIKQQFEVQRLEK